MTVEIAGRAIGAGARCFVIAEAGVNHDGDLRRALALVDAAAEAGADAVKFQTFRADAVASAEARNAPYQGAGTQQELLRALELSADDHTALVDACASRGVVFLSTPFDEESADLLDELDVPAFKIASPDVTNLPFLEYVARKGRPVLLSTGMSTLDEVRAAARALAPAPGLVLLHCVSAYPAPAADANLRAMATMREQLGVPVGFSDHTAGIEVALAAVALGASVVEKHLTVDRGLPGPDHAASLEPDELRALVEGVRRVEAALGDGEKRPAPSEAENRDLVRRSLAARRDLEEGTVLEPAMLTALRPATGIAPAQMPEVVGRRLRRGLLRGELLGPADIE